MSSGRSVLILGLDGADWRIIDPLLAQGALPGLASLIDRGARAPLGSSIPPVSAAAWVSFLLGAPPGRHGILDFREVDARRYEGSTGHVITSHDYAKRTLFDAAGAAGLSVASVRVPMTYPAWPVNGVMIAGPPTPDDRRLYCHPHSLAEELDVGTLDVGNRLLEYPRGRQMRTLAAQLERSRDLGTRVLRRGAFDLAMIAVNTPDNAHHCFWDERDPQAPNDPINHFYVEVDRFVQAILSQRRFDLVVVLSDHGGGPRPATQVSVNGLLASLGYLHPAGGARATLPRVAAAARRSRRVVRLVRRWAPERAQRAVSGLTQGASAIRWDRTVAYGVHLFHPFFGVEINLAGRQGAGVVEPEGFEATRSRVAEDLRQVVRIRSLPVRRVMTREEAYGSDADPRLPDLVLEFPVEAEGVNGQLDPMVRPSPPVGRHETRSYHATEGILVVAGEGVVRGAIDAPRIEDIAPTVLRYLGLPAPVGMTGRPLSELFEAGYLASTPAAPADRLPTEPEPPPSGPPISSRDEERILESLRGLGYVE